MAGRVLADRFRAAQLFDVYGRLLTSRQQRLVQRYFLDDLSLGEIAGQLAITRQAVYDSLRRATAELEHLEEVLHLLALRRQQARQLQQLAERVDALERRVAQLDGHLEGERLEPLHEALLRLRQTLTVR